MNRSDHRIRDKSGLRIRSSKYRETAIIERPKIFLTFSIHGPAFGSALTPQPQIIIKGMPIPRPIAKRLAAPLAALPPAIT